MREKKEKSANEKDRKLKRQREKKEKDREIQRPRELEKEEEGGRPRKCNRTLEKKNDMQQIREKLSLSSPPPPHTVCIK